MPEMVQGLINGTSLSTGAGLNATATGFAAGAAANIYPPAWRRQRRELAREQITEPQLRGEAPASRAGSSPARCSHRRQYRRRRGRRMSAIG